jgi:hypothetical protein
VNAFVLEVLIEPEAQTAGVGANNSVDAGVIVARSSEYGHADLLLADFAAAAFSLHAADVEQETDQALGLIERRRGDDTLDQRAFGYSADSTGGDRLRRIHVKCANSCH